MNTFIKHDCGTCFWHNNGCQRSICAGDYQWQADYRSLINVLNQVSGMIDCEKCPLHNENCILIKFGGPFLTQCSGFLFEYFIGKFDADKRLTK